MDKSDIKPFSGLQGLAVAPVSSYNGFNTSIQRINALRRLGVGVQELDTGLVQASGLGWNHYRLRHWLFRKGFNVRLSDPMNDNGRLCAAAMSRRLDILWIDKGLTIRADVLSIFRQYQPECAIIGFSPDDMGSRHNQSLQFLEHLQWYDIFFTTKSYNVSELLSLGCRQVVFTGNGYDPTVFRPIPAKMEEAARTGESNEVLGRIGYIAASLGEQLEADEASA